MATSVHTLRWSAPTVALEVAPAREVRRTGAERGCVIAERILHAGRIAACALAPRLPGVGDCR
jgi:hypothetical protein